MLEICQHMEDLTAQRNKSLREKWTEAEDNDDWRHKLIIMTDQYDRCVCDSTFAGGDPEIGLKIREYIKNICSSHPDVLSRIIEDGQDAILLPDNMWRLLMTRHENNLYDQERGGLA